MRSADKGFMDAFNLGYYKGLKSAPIFPDESARTVEHYEEKHADMLITALARLKSIINIRSFRGYHTH